MSARLWPPGEQNDRSRERLEPARAGRRPACSPRRSSRSSKPPSPSSPSWQRACRLRTELSTGATSTCSRGSTRRSRSSGSSNGVAVLGPVPSRDVPDVRGWQEDHRAGDTQERCRRACRRGRASRRRGAGRFGWNSCWRAVSRPATERGRHRAGSVRLGRSRPRYRLGQSRDLTSGGWARRWSRVPLERIPPDVWSRSLVASSCRQAACRGASR